MGGVFQSIGVFEEFYLRRGCWDEGTVLSSTLYFKEGLECIGALANTIGRAKKGKSGALSVSMLQVEANRLFLILLPNYFATTHTSPPSFPPPKPLFPHVNALLGFLHADFLPRPMVIEESVRSVLFQYFFGLMERTCMDVLV